MDISTFRKRIIEEDFNDVLENILLSNSAVHVDSAKQEYIKNQVAKAFNMNFKDIELYVVGSAGLGFSLIEKVIKRERRPPKILPRYRVYNANSDIDIAIVSRNIYELIWDELSVFSTNQPWFPWRSGKLGDYKICGWLRPDYFPSNKRLRMCDNWKDLFIKLSADPILGRRRIRGGLFYNFESLKRYQGRGLKECIRQEKI